MSRLVLNNNGLSDDDLAIVLTGLQEMETISVMDLRKNIVGEKTVLQMANFMARPFPRHLQVLRIVDCKMDHKVTYMLLRLLN